MTDLEEIKRRRTFAIISHPDAGKTTLTEKLLLYGGAIHLAGSVKARKTARYAVSDWMEIEKQRGISVTSSVLQFDYQGCRINILDTPGHADFSEDTYRTLMAVDSAVMVIDVAKGVEAQTKKLFKVCSDRGIPIFTFVNKIDHFGKNPFDLMADIEDVLGIRSCPMNWPIGVNGDYTGIYDRETEMCHLFIKDNAHGVKKLEVISGKMDDEKIVSHLTPEIIRSLQDDLELLDEAGDPFDAGKVARGELTPMFFGSAMTNFGVQPFLEKYLELAPPPEPRKTLEGTISPEDPNFSAFVFKIQANMNKAHRDRIAFMRVVSGRFDADKEVYHLQGGKKIRLSRPQQLMAAEREIIEEAYAGDIIGVFDPGIFSIGDTVTVPGKKFKFSGIPTFAPEHFARVSARDSMKRKQFVKGTEQIAQEGAIQIFKVPGSGMEEVIVGVVGVLQFDVFQYRMKNEYGVELRMDHLPYEELRLIDSYPGDLQDLNLGSDAELLEDYRDRKLLVFTSFWAIDFTCRRNPGLQLSEITVDQDAGEA